MKHTLHLLTKNSVPTLLPSDAAVVLIHDATYLLLQQPIFKSVYVLKDDLLARGLSSANAIVIDYNELVSFTAEYNKVITWA